MRNIYVNPEKKIFAYTEEGLYQIVLEYFNYFLEHDSSENAESLLAKEFTEVSFEEFKEKSYAHSLINMPYFKEIQIRRIIKSNKDKDMRLKPIREYFDKDRNRCILDIVEISNDLQVVHYEDKIDKENVEQLYMPFIKYSSTQQAFNSLELAIIYAICYKQGTNQAAHWIGKMIGLDDTPDK